MRSRKRSAVAEAVVPTWRKPVGTILQSWTRRSRPSFRGWNRSSSCARRELKRITGALTLARFRPPVACAEVRNSFSTLLDRQGEHNAKKLSFCVREILIYQGNPDPHYVVVWPNLDHEWMMR